MKRSVILLLTATVLPFLAARGGELDTLRQRCSEQERQIRELEAENARLRGQLNGDAETTTLPIVAEKTEAKPVEAEKADTAAGETKAPATPAAATGHNTTHTVKAGETLTKIARRYGVTPEAITKANRLKDPSVVRVGSKLIIPGSSKPAATNAADPPAAAIPSGSATNHTIAQRETLYGIARKYSTTVQAIIEANPGIDPTNLKIGSQLKIPGKSSSATNVPEKANPTEAETPPTAKEQPKPGNEAASTVMDQPKTGNTTAKPADPAPDPEEEPVAETGIRKITIAEQTTFGEFAAQHGTTPEKLNALNGLSLSTATVLAKGSELYVPGKP